MRKNKGRKGQSGREKGRGGRSEESAGGRKSRCIVMEKKGEGRSEGRKRLKLK